MSASSTSSASATTAVIVAIMALIPLGWQFVRDDSPATTTTTTVAADPTPLEVAPPSIPGLDESISKVLYADGVASAVDEKAPDLAPEIVRVLVFYDVTLTVPATGGTP